MASTLQKVAMSDGTTCGAVQILNGNEDVNSVIDSIMGGGQTDPFYVCNLSDVIWKYKNWMEVFPRVQPFYAVKCNGSKTVLETLAKIGANFDCASANEISSVISLGVHPDRIIFANPAKKETHIKYAADVGVRVLTFDCVNELYKVKKFHPKARLVLRICHDDKDAKYQFGRKYGVKSESEAEKVLELASSLKLDVVGVCFHIGSCCNDIKAYEYAISKSRRVFDIATKLGYTFDLLDIGGGFLGHKGSSIDKIGMVINSALDKYFPDESVRISSEPGRYFVSSAFTLLTQINTIRKVEEPNPDSNHPELVMYYLDIGIFNSLCSALVGERYKFKPYRKNALNRKLLPSIVWGPTCNCIDVITDGVEYLPEMKVGEWIMFENTGAYTMSMSCDFNGFLRPRIFPIINKQDMYQMESKYIAKP